MKKKNVIIILLLIGVMAILTNCANYVDYQITEVAKTYGFWGGLWHGFIILFSFIGSLFSDNIVVYAVNNNGGWYDFGYFLGIGIATSSSAQGSKKYHIF